MSKALFHERSGMPGRVRYGIPKIQSDPPLARQLQDAVKALPNVRSATANPVSAGLLVVFDPKIPLGEFQGGLEALLPGLVRGLRPPANGGSSPRRPLSPVLRAYGRPPEDLAGPVIASLCAYSVATLQTRTFAAMLSVAEGEPEPYLVRLGITRPRSQLVALAAAATLLSGPLWWVNHAKRKAWRTHIQETEHMLRSRLFAHLQAQDLEFFEQHGAGTLMALLVGEVGRVSGLVEEVDGVIDSTLNVLLAGGSLLKNSPAMALIAGITVPAMFTPMKVMKPQVLKAYADQASTSSELQQALENIFSGIVEVKSFTAEQIEGERVEELSGRLAGQAIDAAVFPSRQVAAGGNIYYAGYIPALFYGANKVLAGRLPKSGLSTVNYWYPKLVSSVGRFQDSTGKYYSAVAAADRILSVLDSSSQIDDGTVALQPERVRGEIVLDDVTFGYLPGRPVLKGLSLTIPAGQTLGIVGHSGSGKSTMLRLLLRFYQANSGTITLDGQDVRDLRLKDLRAAVALVSQDVYLFNGTVRHNVLYGRSSAGDSEVIEALDAAGARDLLESLPDGLNTDVGEHGSRLSGGQRQRVAIARALLKGAPILAMDEPTAHLDYATEAAVKESLKNATRGKTVILIAHRLTSVRDADNIIVLDGGVIEEQGRHEELVGNGGLYAQLWELQS